MENAVIQRIKEIKKNEKLTNDSFSERTNIPVETVKSMFSKNTNPSLDTIQKIYSAFPHYSIEWIITGNGDKYAGSKNVLNSSMNYLLNLLIDTNNSYSTKSIASELDISVSELNKILSEKGVIRKEGNLWILCDNYLGNNYQKPTVYIDTKSNTITENMVWTLEGRAFIHSLFEEVENTNVSEKSNFNNNVTIVDTNFLVDRIEKLAIENYELKKEVEKLKIKPYKENNEVLTAAEPK